MLKFNYFITIFISVLATGHRVQANDEKKNGRTKVLLIRRRVCVREEEGKE